jgi:hypothetical protein
MLELRGTPGTAQLGGEGDRSERGIAPPTDLTSYALSREAVYDRTNKFRVLPLAFLYLHEV